MKNIYSQPNKSEENINDLYYDALESLGDGRGGAKEAEKMLKEALKMDEHYVQTYIGLICVYGALKNKKKTEEYIKKAYDETVRQFPKWPKDMLWGYLENRAFLRAIQYRADLYMDDGEKEKAIELYKLLLKLNPGDNQGVRYVLSGVYAGISGEEINNMFDEGNDNQDWSKLERLVQEQNTKHKFWKEPKWD